MKRTLLLYRSWGLGVGALVVAVLLANGSQAQAQYSGGFVYYNRGFGYAQGWSMPRGGGFVSGFGVISPRGGFGTVNGFLPGGRYFSGNVYGAGRTVYGQGWSLNRGGYRGGTFYIRR
jgi:hypothetical protein